MANTEKEISSADAIALLNKWKSGSANVFVEYAFSGVRTWLLGKVSHASEAEIHFRIEGIDDKDFLLAVVCSRARFFRARLDEPTSMMIAPRRQLAQFGTSALQIELHSDVPGTNAFRITVAEDFLSAPIDIVAE